MYKVSNIHYLEIINLNISKNWSALSDKTVPACTGSEVLIN